MEQQQFEQELDRALRLAREHKNVITREQLQALFGDVYEDEKHRAILLAYFQSKNVTVAEGEKEKNEAMDRAAVMEECAYNEGDKAYIET